MAVVLLVTSDPDEAHRLASVLEDCGHIVLAEHTARSALACLAKEPIDVLVCDEVPGTMACQLVCNLRQHRRAHLPAVILAALPGSSHEDVSALSDVHVLSAPIEERAVIEAVSRAAF